MKSLHLRRSLFLAGLFLVLMTLIYQLPHTVGADIGAPGDAALIDGFSFAEGAGNNTFRWSSGLDSISLPGAGSRDWELHLRVSGLRPSGLVSLTVTTDDQQRVGTLTLGGEMSEYALPISQRQIGASGDARIQLESPTFNAPPDPRDLGVQVDWVELRPAGSGPTLPPWNTLLSLTLTVLLVGLALGRVGVERRGWWVAAAALLALLAGGLLFFRLWINVYRLWLLAGAVLLWLVAGWMRGARVWEWLALVAVVVSGYWFGVRALNFYGTGLPPGDFSIYFTAAKNLRQGLPIYDFKAASEMPNGPVYKYPPLFAMLLAPLAMYSDWSVAAGWYLLNLGLYVVTFFLLIRVVRSAFPPETLAAGGEGRGGGRNRLFVLLSALLFLNFQPTWESLIRGQLDVLILALVISGLWFYQRRQAEWIGGVLLAFVTMLKLYPGLLWVYLIWQRRWSAAIGFIVGFAALAGLSGAVAGWGVLWRYGREVLTVQTAAVPYPENQSWTGFLARFLIPAADTTWYTTIPFAEPARLLLYALVLATLIVTVRWIWHPASKTDQRFFLLGYSATLLVMVMVWPTSWIHYETLLLPAFVLLLRDQFEPQRRSWPVASLLLLSFLLLAIGNEYTVLTPWIHQDGWPRLLQSYRFYGMLLLWALEIYSARHAAKTL